jgi:hypothetical protein
VVAGAGMLDELADSDEGGGEVGVEDGDGVVAGGHPAEFAVAVHPGAGAFDSQRRVAWMGAGMPLQEIWAAAAMSLWWLVGHTG